MSGLELRDYMCHAASHGKIDRMKIFLEAERSPQWLDECLNKEYKHKNPLVTAARQGHTEIVSYLLSKGADPSVTGSVTFDGEEILGAPPLWAAAAAGFLDVVKVLVNDAKVNINQTTSTQSTPLRGACYDGHFEIVKFLVEKGASLEIPNRHGHTCLMIAAYRQKTEIVRYFLEKKADVNVQTAKGNTVLHDAAEGGTAEITRLLLDAGARMMPDDFGLCPLLTSALYGNLEVVDLLLEREPSNLKKRDALKLVGCFMVDKKMDTGECLKYWKRALEIELNPEEMDELTSMELNEEPKAVYDYIGEIQHLHDCAQLEHDYDKIHMMSLVIRERILGSKHQEVHYFLRFRGAIFCDVGKIKKCYDLWAHALDLQQKHFFPMHHSTVATLMSFQETFLVTLNDLIVHRGHPSNDDLEVVKRIFNLTCYELERLYDWGDKPLIGECCGEEHSEDVFEEVNRVSGCALQLIILLIRMANVMGTEKEEYVFDQVHIENFVLVCRLLDIKLLHLALEDSDRSNHKFPWYRLIELLIEAGVDVNEVDETTGKSALHCLLNDTFMKKTVVRTLLEKGAYVTSEDGSDNNIMEMLMEVNETLRDPAERIPVGEFITLKGLAARAFVRKVLRKERDYMPPTFQPCNTDLVPSDLMPLLRCHGYDYHEPTKDDDEDEPMPEV